VQRVALTDAGEEVFERLQRLLAGLGEQATVA
jgi:DNA-binding transcriptional LysR family regulator